MGRAPTTEFNLCPCVTYNETSNVAWKVQGVQDRWDCCISCWGSQSWDDGIDTRGGGDGVGQPWWRQTDLGWWLGFWLWLLQLPLQRHLGFRTNLQHQSPVGWRLWTFWISGLIYPCQWRFQFKIFRPWSMQWLNMCEMSTMHLGFFWSPTNAWNFKGLPLFASTSRPCWYWGIQQEGIVFHEGWREKSRAELKRFCKMVFEWTSASKMWYHWNLCLSSNQGAEEEMVWGGSALSVYICMWKCLTSSKLVAIWCIL